MEIISLKHTGKVVYDKFSLGFSSSDENLCLIDEYHQHNQFSMTLQEYELSKEQVIWLSSNYFSELQFDDVWLIFSRLDKFNVENVFSELKSRLPEISKQKTPNTLRQELYKTIDELREASTNHKKLAIAT